MAAKNKTSVSNPKMFAVKQHKGGKTSPSSLTQEVFLTIIKTNIKK